jgi:transposase-like protein
MAETGRARWIERVEQWKQSGLTARDYAAQAGLNAGTLCYWKWRLSREAKLQTAPRAVRKRRPRAPKLVELTPVSLVDEQVEIELSNGHRLRVPARLDAQALSRLIEIGYRPTT